MALQTRFELNKQIARVNRASFDAVGITAISLVGPAGSGKTSLIETLLARLNSKLRIAAIVANLAAERHVERIARYGCQAIPLVTDNVAAINVREVLNRLNPGKFDLLLIESESNAHSPVEFDLGQHLRASVFSIAGGDDKATESPFLIAGSDIVLLTKIDLLPLVRFDFKVFSQDVERIKPDMRILQLSVQSKQGVDRWIQWVESHLSHPVMDPQSSRTFDPFIRISNQ